MQYLCGGVRVIWAISFALIVILTCTIPLALIVTIIPTPLGFDEDERVYDSTGPSLSLRPSHC